MGRCSKRPLDSCNPLHTPQLFIFIRLQALARGEKMEQLVDKSEALNDGAGQFQRGSTALRRKMQCRYYKVLALLALVALAVVAYIAVPLIIGAH